MRLADVRQAASFQGAFYAGQRVIFFYASMEQQVLCYGKDEGLHSTAHKISSFYILIWCSRGASCCIIAT